MDRLALGEADGRLGDYKPTAGDRQGLQLDNAITVNAILSCLASLVIIYFYVCFPHLRNRSAKLIIWLAVSNTLLSASVIIFLLSPILKSEEYSDAFAFLINFHLLANMFWTCAMSKTMALVILQRDQLFRMLSSSPHSPKRLGLTRMAKFHLSIWLGALAFSLIPWFLGAYQSYRHSWYWYKEDFQSQILCWLCYMLPLVSGSLYNLYILLSLDKAKYTFQGNELYDTLTGDTLAGELYNLVMALKNYPIISVAVCLVALTTQLVYTCVGASSAGAALGLFLFTGLLQISQGFFCLIIYLAASYFARRRRVISRRLASRCIENRPPGHIFNSSHTAATSNYCSSEKNVLLDRFPGHEGTDNDSSISQLRQSESSAISASQQSQIDGDNVDFDPGQIVECALDLLCHCLACRNYHEAEECLHPPLAFDATSNPRQTSKTNDKFSTLTHETPNGSHSHLDSHKLGFSSYSNALYGQDQSFSGHSIFSNDGVSQGNNLDGTESGQNPKLFDSLLVASESDRRKVSSDGSIRSNNKYPHI